MKAIRLLTIALCLGLFAVLSACDREDPSADFNPASLELPGEGGSQTVTLTANYDWTAKASDPWFQVTPASGKKGTVTLTIQASANDKASLRKGNVSVTLKDFTRSLPVSQLPNLDQALTIQHSGSSFTVPMMTGSTLSGKVNWGDGKEETYKVGLSHDYASSDSHTVLIKSAGAYSFKLESVAGVSEIDLQNF